jgi:5'-3' exonuclease
MKLNLSLIDADFIVFYICHNKKGEVEKTLEDVYGGIDTYVDYLLKRTNTEKYIGFVGSGKTFRHELNPKYKANRDYSNPLPFMKEAKEYMINKWKFVSFPNIEADDCVLITENNFKDKYNVTVIAVDKDLKNTEGHRFNPMKNEFIDTTDIQDLEYFWRSMIIGDSADGIIALKGLGVKFCDKEFANFQADDYKSGIVRNVIFDLYCKRLGEYKGIEEFYKTYYSLKILKEYEPFKITEEDMVDYKLE